MQNLHRRFVLCSNGQIYGGDFAKFCGLLRIYELYLVIESKRSEMSIVLFFVGIFSKEGLSLVEIAVAIGVSTTVISLQNVTIRPATCRNMSEPLINCVIKN